MGHLWLEGADGVGLLVRSRRPISLVRLFLSRARRTKTPNSPRSFIQNCNFANHRLHSRGEDQLGNARPPLDGEGRVPEIGQDHLDLTAIVGIHRAGRIEHGDSVT